MGVTLERRFLPIQLTLVVRDVMEDALWDVEPDSPRCTVDLRVVSFCDLKPGTAAVVYALTS